MKILITTDTYAPIINGVVTSILNLTRALTALGHTVRILTLASDASSERRQDNVYYLPSLKCGIYPDARVTFPFRSSVLRDIEAWSPDIIHSQSEFSSFLCAKHLAKRAGVPLIHTYHTLYEDYTHYFCPNQQLGVLAVRGFTRMISRSVSLLCAPSVKVQRTLLDYGISAPISVLPTGIDLSHFTAPVSERDCVARKRALGLPSDCHVLLALGRLAKEKNYDELLDNAAPLLREMENVYLVIVGDGPYRADIAAAVCARGLSDKVRMTGMVSAEEVPTYYHMSDVFLCASSSETQGLTYLEAMACGLPQIVRRDACLDGVIVNGRNGYQYETPEECRAYLDKLLSHASIRHEISHNAVIDADQFGMETFGRRAETRYLALVQHEALRHPALICERGI